MIGGKYWYGCLLERRRLAGGEPSVENSGGALRTGTVGVHGCVFAAFCAVAILMLFCGLAAHGAVERYYRELPQPVFSVLIAALVLGEMLHPMQTAGMSLVLVAIVLIQFPERSGRAEERSG